MMRMLLRALPLMLIAGAVIADDGAVFREPYKLQVHLDKEHYAEYPIGKVPFVHSGAVYLYKDDNFGLKLEVDNGKLKAVRYAPDAKDADVALRFTQNINEDGSSMMLLEIVNRTRYKLATQALMAVPNQQGTRPTSILPVEPGLVNFESWPHPIVQLVLYKLEVTQ